MSSELTDKQQRFVEEYLIDLNATQAAIRAGYSIRPCGSQQGYYVYFLVDSRNDEIFYVGKGKGKRYASHVREWKSSRTDNPTKCDRIGDILGSGHKVVALCFEDGVSEADAYALERSVIKLIGLNRLTNAARGQMAQTEREIRHAKAMLSRIKIFDHWMAERNRTKFEQDLYWRVIDGYRTIASGNFKQSLRTTPREAA